MPTDVTEGQIGEAQTTLKFERELSEIALMSRERLFSGLKNAYQRYLNVRNRFGYPGGIVAFSEDYITKAAKGLVNVSIDGADITYLVKNCEFSEGDTFIQGLNAYLNRTEASV